MIFLFETKKETVTLTLLNVHSLDRNFVDIMSDEHLRENETLYLTETQILPNEKTYPIETAFQSQFLYQFNSSKNKFSSIVLGFQININIVSWQRLDDISKVVFQKEDFSQQPLSLVILYGSPSSLVATFLDVIRYFVCAKIEIILGDFNINVLDDEILNP